MDEMNLYREDFEEQTRERIRRAKRSGVLKGSVITAMVMIFTLMILCAVYLGMKIRKGTVLSLLNEGGTLSGGSVVTSQVQGKLDAMKAVIDSWYYESYDQAELENGIYKGFMSGLGDPYSTYYTKEEYAEMLEEADGTFEGIGAYLQQDAETMQIKVVRPIAGSPAEEVGVLAEDIILEVDGEDVSGQDLNLVVSKIRGPTGSRVQIRIYRPSLKEERVFEIERAQVESQTVEYQMLEDHVGYLLLLEFDDVTTGQFKNAMEDLNSQGMERLILDMRDNPGGNVDVAVAIADYICPEGPVVTLKMKSGKEDVYSSDATHHFDKPMVVLVNENSASAAEILCGALLDYNKAILVGKKTFGKGIVQQILPMGDGTGIKVTIGRYYSPNGTSIHGEGFVPEVEADLDVEKYLEEGIDTQVEKAFEVVKER